MSLDNRRDSRPIPFSKPRVFYKQIKTDRLRFKSVLFDETFVPIYMSELTCKRMYSKRTKEIRLR